jgi:hypothetical protein
MPGKGFHMDKARLELEIGFGDFEHLAASLLAFPATFEICRNDRICRQEQMPNSGRDNHSFVPMPLAIALGSVPSRRRGVGMLIVGARL